MLAASSELDGLDEYREQADRFLADLEEEHYRHFAGLKPALELERIYERNADLFSLETCHTLESGPSELWRFACEEFLANATSEQTQTIAGLEATLLATIENEPTPYRLLPPRIANEPDRERRERLDQARIALAEELNPSRLSLVELTRQAVTELGATSYRGMFDHFGFPLEALGLQCTRFLEQTEDLWADALDQLLRDRLGLTRDDARRSDLPRVLRAPHWDSVYTSAGMRPALEATLAGMGIDLHAQGNIQLDLDVRPTKSPRAFCSPIEVPGRVVLVTQPLGGLNDWQALFHEAGHAEHFAHTSPALPLEARRLGDNAVTEGYAFLLEHLVTNRTWLRRRLDVGPVEEIARESALVQLFFVRRYCAKLLYELELHGGTDLVECPDRYVAWMRAATGVEYSPADFLSDVDIGFYCSSYLRAWALEAQLARFLSDEYGNDWFANRRAAGLLRELWNEGQQMSADTIANEVAGAALELDAVADAIRAIL